MVGISMNGVRCRSYKGVVGRALHAWFIGRGGHVGICSHSLSIWRRVVISGVSS